MRLFFLLTLIVEINPIEYEDNSKVSLAQLPLDKLLHVKNSLDSSRVISLLGDHRDLKIELEDDEELDEDQDFSEAALPLKGDWFKTKRKKKKGEALRRDGWDEKGEKKGDLASIFQSTITILSFLAFGGYLLCMICMAIRNNQGMLTTTTAAPAAFVVPGRRRRAVDESPLMHDIFDSLVKLSEGYAKYHIENNSQD